MIRNMLRETLRSSRPIHLIELEHAMPIFALFGGISDNQLSIIIDPFDDRLFSTLSRSKGPNPTKDSDITCATHMLQKSKGATPHQCDGYQKCESKFTHLLDLEPH